MSTVLRVYDPPECDERGYALDWEKCRTCGGIGEEHGRQGNYGTIFTSCSACDGHGSLKAAALFEVGDQRQVHRHPGATPHKPRSEWPGSPFRVRCEDCGHPMSEGTWEGDLRKPPRRQGKLFDEESAGGGYLTFDHPEAATEEDWQRVHRQAAWTYLVRGSEPPADRCPAVHYSPCDEGCRHGGPVHLAGTVAWDGAKAVEWELRNGWTTADAIKADPQPDLLASWRPVDIRTLGWAADLRPEKLAVLCLRCYAERKR